MKNIRYAVMVALGIVLSTGCSAESDASSESTGKAASQPAATVNSSAEQAVNDKVKSIVGVEPEAIANSPVDGLLEVTAANQVFYVTENADYMMFGHMYDVNAGMKDLTEVALGQVRLDAIAPFADQGIEFKAENEKHVMTVFTDYTCGYCKKLHREVDELNEAGITVRYLAWPRAGLGTENYENMVSIWCAKNPQEALTRAKSIANPTFAKEDCDNTVAEQFVAGRKLGIRGTPAIIFDNGTMLPGYKPADVLIQEIAQTE
ncbi:DsbC family protein [Alteromonas sp. RKMC-009]|uniref:DsbC family protein n=1 Tax=Alteromonas sp. RKMC-009 TaxID=2267264 RepID=UPI000E695DDD|nr:DsbC family protein [Alteromonas sp. RKMC-009]AYA63280.1 DsbC family protein [Alteromonas sp. RKMC-009]MEC7691565.1 DsbC family protein [Pseudomonadota bacterium]